MKTCFLIVILMLALFVSANLASASFTTGNFSIETSYAPGENLRGWINISLQNEPASSLLSAFSDNIGILDFLKNNDLFIDSDFTCSPIDCESGYSESGKATNKTFSLNFGDKKLIGLKINGNIEGISSFSMNIESDAGESGYPQLFVDILNDNKLEWRAYLPSGNFAAEDYGCYNSGEIAGQAEITQTDYCEKITLPLSSNVKIGADVIENTGGAVDFEIRIYNDDYDKSCTASTSGSGKISCSVDLVVTEEQDFFVCIRTKDYNDNKKYKINYEQNAPCGFSGSYEEYDYDFAIFAQAGEYAPIGSFALNDDEVSNAGIIINLKEYIGDYVNDRYDNDCTNGCIIPIEFISGEQQTIIISNVGLTYTSGITTTTSSIYDLIEEPAEIDMNFQKLDLEKANLSVPTSYGNKTLSLRLDGIGIASEKIKIVKAPVIDSVIPLNLPAAMPVRFIVFASGNATKYRWEFGDGTTGTTTENNTYHTYSEIGLYELKVTAINNAGESSKTFSVNVKSPEEEINRTIAEKKQDLNAIKKQVETLTGWYKGEINNILALDAIEAELNNLEKQYELASLSSEYVKIMTNLMNLKVPSSLKSSSSSGDFLPSPENIDPIYLIELTENVENPKEYTEGIIAWINENIEIKIENKGFYLQYPNEQAPVLTASVLKIKAKKNLGEVFLIIDRNYAETTFKENYNEKAVGEATVITFSALEKDKEEVIEFILPEKIELMNLPLYISPEFSQLPDLNGEISPCDNDGVCEKAQGETEENCINDCHTRPWGKIMMWIGILLFIAFVVYITLQEWYKRHYEKHLFRNRNDLYNLINFINNALNQGFEKKVIMKKLEDYNWNSEQIIYALKKLKGKRTGMWEIPIFRPFEKRKLKKELEKRKKWESYVPAQY